MRPYGRTSGGRVFDFDHEMAGEVDAIYFCDSTGVPSWLSFTTDFFAERDAFVPAAQITFLVTGPFDSEHLA
jgi:hypothetical protein